MFSVGLLGIGLHQLAGTQRIARGQALMIDIVVVHIVIEDMRLVTGPQNAAREHKVGIRGVVEVVLAPPTAVLDLISHPLACTVIVAVEHDEATVGASYDTARLVRRRVAGRRDCLVRGAPLVGVRRVIARVKRMIRDIGTTAFLDGDV